MRISNHSLRRQTAVCLAVLLAVPFGSSATAFAQETIPSQPVNGISSSQQPPQLPDTGRPGAIDQTTDQSRQAGVPKTAQGQQNGGAPAPVGTAAAPYEKGIGVAASRPAGAVIAPAKQRRNRSFLIRIGLVVGACVAVGTVVGLSKASPSQPQVSK